MKKNPRIILITTTIRVPAVLSRYRHMRKDVLMIVVGDQKTPHKEVHSFVKKLGNAQYLSVEDQEKLHYRVSPIIGWNSIQRRNIGVLEALKNRADIIISIDDDNIPVEESYFDDMETVLTKPFSGLSISSPEQWVNIGNYMTPRIYHRGFPYDKRHMDLRYVISGAQNLAVGFAAGLWYGDPDIDAMERITNRPIVTSFADFLQKGLVVSKPNFAPFNSQNTAFIRELTPLFLMLIGVGRHDDIWASYIAQRVMQTTPYHLHYGKPFVWQERNAQSLWKNLKDEVYGMENTPQFASDLRTASIPEQGNVIEKATYLYQYLSKKSYIPSVVSQLGSAWLEDIKKVTR